MDEKDLKAIEGRERALNKEREEELFLKKLPLTRYNMTHALVDKKTGLAATNSFKGYDFDIPDDIKEILGEGEKSKRVINFDKFPAVFRESVFLEKCKIVTDREGKLDAHDAVALTGKPIHEYNLALAYQFIHNQRSFDEFYSSLLEECPKAEDFSEDIKKSVEDYKAESAKYIDAIIGRINKKYKRRK